MEDFRDARELVRECGEDVRLEFDVTRVRPWSWKGMRIGSHVSINADFYCTAGELVVEDWVHLSVGTKILGGIGASVRIGAFTGIAAGVIISGVMDSYHEGFMNGVIPEEYRILKKEAVVLGQCNGIAPYVVIEPGCVTPEGIALGMGTLLQARHCSLMKPWEIWAGRPAKKVGEREPIDERWKKELMEKWESKNKLRAKKG